MWSVPLTTMVTGTWGLVNRNAIGTSPSWNAMGCIVTLLVIDSVAMVTSPRSVLTDPAVLNPPDPLTGRNRNLNSLPPDGTNGVSVICGR